MRGDDFTEKHWIEVFTLLGMTSKPIDILCLSDFLDVLDALIEHAQQLQVRNCFLLMKLFTNKSCA